MVAVTASARGTQTAAVFTGMRSRTGMALSAMQSRRPQYLCLWVGAMGRKKPGRAAHGHARRQ